VTVEEKAKLLIDSVTKALANGCCHYDPETGQFLSDPKAILTCLRDKKQVRVHEPRRCPCGHREYEDSKLICQECGLGLPVLAATEQS